MAISLIIADDLLANLRIEMTNPDDAIGAATYASGVRRRVSHVSSRRPIP